MGEPPTTDLPVEAVVDDVRAVLAAGKAAVLAASPGAGKTTVVPLRLVGEPWLSGRRIVVLEPRRIATRAAARRMASLLGEEVGQTVGYRTRTDRAIGPRTRIEVVTEGMLTARIQRDPELAGVGLVVFDEFHERSLQADLGLALALDVRDALRPDLRLLVMSATLDTDRVAALIGHAGAPAPVVTAPGRSHDVEVVWAPRTGRTTAEAAAVEATRSALRSEEGDALVFLAGAAQIRRVVADLRRSVPADVDVRPLFGALSPVEQDLALAPSPAGRRKVVVATDIAESSLTVEGVRTVVDAGLRRVMRHDPRTGMGRLVTIGTSRASAEQRAGRAGREAPGRAVRLWSRIEHGTRPAFDPPEIALADLAGLLLEAACWGTAPHGLRLLDQPDAAAVKAAQELLVALGALDDDGHITPKGRAMAGLPLHPRLAAMIVDHRPGPDGWTACVAAAIVEHGDVLRGRPDELPVDLAVRVGLVEDRQRSHPQAAGHTIGQVRRDARDLARRADIEPGRADAQRLGRVLLSAYPDRLAQKRLGRGRYLLRSGQGAWLPDTDALSGEALLVVADLDGVRGDARVRMAAGVDADEVAALIGDRGQRRTVVVWDEQRGDVVARVDDTLGALTLRSVGRAVEPSPAVTALLVDAVRSSGLRLLPWRDRDRRLQARIELARRHGRLAAPAVDDNGLLADIDSWLAPALDGAPGIRDLARLDLANLLLTRVGWHHRHDLDRLVPEQFTLPSGRRVVIDYARERPTISGRVQEFYGTAEVPAVLDGAVALTVELLSPANRPVQVTADLAGFWTGSWREVRKEMAGRYPKHRWPEDPTTAEPGRSTRRRP